MLEMLTASAVEVDPLANPLVGGQGPCFSYVDGRLTNDVPWHKPNRRIGPLQRTQRSGVRAFVDQGCQQCAQWREYNVDSLEHGIDGISNRESRRPKA